MEKFKRSLKDAGLKDFTKIADKLRENGTLFQCDFEQLTRHVLSKFIEGHVFEMSFNELRSNYLKELGPIKRVEVIASDGSVLDLTTEIPTSEKDFYKYFCRLFLHLDKLPRDYLLKMYDQCIEDINSINSTLAQIDEKLAAIKARNDATEIQEKNPIFHFYREQNVKAKDEIINFMLNDIKTYALNECYDFGSFSFFLKNIPYNYRWSPSSYTPRKPSDLENKFMEMTMPDLKELKEDYRNNKPKFQKFVTEYIDREEIISGIRSRLDEHHILAACKEVINQALETYEKGAKIIFANVVPSIIEGILHDLCLLAGDTENNLLTRGFEYKLAYLKNVFSWELFYEYYSFRFRIFRNKVAHGRLSKEDGELLPDMLLLDLNQMCNLVFSTKLRLNQKRFLLKELSTATTPNFNQVIEYLFLQDVEVPEFYDTKAQVLVVETLINSDAFWEHMKNILKTDNDVIKHGIVHMLKKVIKDRKPYDSRCSELLRIAQVKKTDPHLVKEFIRSLRKDY